MKYLIGRLFIVITEEDRYLPLLHVVPDFEKMISKRFVGSLYPVVPQSASPDFTCKDTDIVYYTEMYLKEMVGKGNSLYVLPGDCSLKELMDNIKGTKSWRRNNVSHLALKLVGDGLYEAEMIAEYTRAGHVLSINYSGFEAFYTLECFQKFSEEVRAKKMDLTSVTFSLAEPQHVPSSQFKEVYFKPRAETFKRSQKIIQLLPYHFVLDINPMEENPEKKDYLSSFVWTTYESHLIASRDVVGAIRFAIESEAYEYGLKIIERIPSKGFEVVKITEKVPVNLELNSYLAGTLSTYHYQGVPL